MELSLPLWPEPMRPVPERDSAFFSFEECPRQTLTRFSAFFNATLLYSGPFSRPSLISALLLHFAPVQSPLLCTTPAPLSAA